jgi:hypothetical protein
MKRFKLMAVPIAEADYYEMLVHMITGLLIHLIFKLLDSAPGASCTRRISSRGHRANIRRSFLKPRIGETLTGKFPA